MSKEEVDIGELARRLVLAEAENERLKAIVPALEQELEARTKVISLLREKTTGGGVIEQLVKEGERLKAESEKDHADMRRFQAKFIAADQENRKLKARLELAEAVCESCKEWLTWGKDFDEQAHYAWRKGKE